jgi:hypothetical protein
VNPLIRDYTTDITAALIFKMNKNIIIMIYIIITFLEKIKENFHAHQRYTSNITIYNIIYSIIVQGEMEM